MNDSFLKTNTIKVNKIIACILWITFAAFCFFLGTSEVRSEVVVSLLLELAAVTWFISRKKLVLQTTVILTIAILTCTIPYIESPGAGMLIMVVLCVIALYVNRVLLYGFGGLYNISYIVIYYSEHHVFDTTFLMTIGFIELTIVALYFVCKRSADLIELSARKEAEAKELLNAVDTMVKVVHENTTALNTDIAHCSRDAGVLQKISSVLTTNIHEVAEGIVDQSESLTHISTMMNEAGGQMSGIHRLSQGLADTSGEAGAGFAVVANEVQKLARQCMDTVQQINAIIHNIKRKTQLVVDKATHGSLAVIEGEAISSQVLESIDSIQSTFRQIDEYIITERNLTDQVSSIFNQVREQVENISGIAQKHAAATEEMLATTEEQEHSIGLISEFIGSINNSSVRLQALIEHRNE
ncbi:hypothetical protein QW71_00520 [Paenibacillus sp. IHB B 3415]|uniref:methyl-accepting chemotaxis protein n=1 Tax=Paenibacillus sp. IHB B 3415 TaxID=867080 RepID=UPI0005738475|nr:methyl-accepting chemotaxis protein [Paenibacillus sp. IHB B 3415]KHL97628.1 hypothetical protein QW71_00520 [Paenibacillus sp. IHB B 3415]